MTSEKDAMMATANNYIAKVAAAQSACEAAAGLLTSPISEISANWKGASGMAMEQALEALRTEISAVCGELAALESQMRARAQSIYNNWPEEAKEE